MPRTREELSKLTVVVSARGTFVCMHRGAAPCSRAFHDGGWCVCALAQDLKAELKALGKSVLGKKDELVERLLAAESGTDGAADPAQPADPAAAAAAPAAEEAAKAPASAGAEDATAGNGAAALEDGGTSKGTAEAKRAKIEFTEKVIKAVSAAAERRAPLSSASCFTPSGLGGAAAACSHGWRFEGHAESHGDSRAPRKRVARVHVQMPAKVTVVKPTTSEPLQPTKSETQKLRERADR